MSWRNDEEPGFSQEIELLTRAPWDPTFDNREPGSFYVRTCQTCGAVVDDYDMHRRWHAHLDSLIASFQS